MSLGRPLSVILKNIGTIDLTNHGLSTGAELARYSWAGYSRLESIKIGPGDIVCKYDYDQSGRIAGTEYTNASGSVICKEVSFRDPLGLKGVVRSDTPSEAFYYEYDVLTRLKSEHKGIDTSLVPSSSSTLTQSALNAVISNTSGLPHVKQTDLSYSSGNALTKIIEQDSAGSILSTRTCTENLPARIKWTPSMEILFLTTYQEISFHMGQALTRMTHFED